MAETHSMQDFHSPGHSIAASPIPSRRSLKEPDAKRSKGPLIRPLVFDDVDDEDEALQHAEKLLDEDDLLDASTDQKLTCQSTADQKSISQSSKDPKLISQSSDHTPIPLILAREPATPAKDEAVNQKRKDPPPSTANIMHRSYVEYLHMDVRRLIPVTNQVTRMTFQLQWYNCRRQYLKFQKSSQAESLLRDPTQYRRMMQGQKH